MQKAIIEQEESSMLQNMLLEYGLPKAMNHTTIEHFFGLAEALIEVMQAIRHSPVFIKVPTRKGFEMFQTQDIVRIETHSYFARRKDMPVKNGDGNSTHVYTLWENGHFRMARKISEWKRLLERAGKDFIQTHQSHLINFQHIRRVYDNDGMVVEMKNGDVVPVAERYKVSLMRRLQGKLGDGDNTQG